MYRIANVFCCLLIACTLHAQVLKDASDSLFLKKYITYPQVQVQLSVFFDEQDFSEIPVRYRTGDIDSLYALVRGSAMDAPVYKKISEIASAFGYDSLMLAARSKAKDLFLKKLTYNSRDTNALRNLAEIFMAEFDLEFSAAYYKELIRVAPGKSDGWLGISALSLLTYDFESALKYADSALKISPLRVSCLCQKANVQVLHAFYKVGSQPDTVLTPVAYTGLIDYGWINGLCLSQPGNKYAEMVRNNLVLAGLMIETFYRNPDALMRTSDTSRFILTPQIEDALTRCSEFFKNVIEKEKRIRLFPYRGIMIASYLKNDTATAAEYYRKGMKYPILGKDLPATMVAVKSLTGDMEYAYAIQKNYASRYSTTENLLIAAYLAYITGRSDESEDFSAMVISRNKTEIRALLGMAAIKLSSGDAESAGKFLEQAESMDKNNGEMLFLKAVYFLFENSPLQARSILKDLSEDEYYALPCYEILFHFQLN